MRTDFPSPGQQLLGSWGSLCGDGAREAGSPGLGLCGPGVESTGSLERLTSVKQCNVAEA